MFIKKSKERLIVEALDRIFGRPVKAIISEGMIVKWGEPTAELPSIGLIEEVVEQIKQEEPMRMLREERDLRLAKCDWRMTTDYPHGDQDAWVEYREKLRNIPGFVNDGKIEKPSINDKGEIVFENWPLEPK